MQIKLIKTGVIVALAGSVLAFGGSRGRVTAGAGNDCDHALADLDTFDEASLDADLEDELNDVYQVLNADVEVDTRSLHQAIMNALGDAGDTGLETRICLADLEAEMREDNTTVSDMVWEALNSDDEAAAGRTMPLVFHAAMSVRAAAQDNGTRTPRNAVRSTKKKAEGHIDNQALSQGSLGTTGM